jgi:hypothetical protein
MNCRRYRQAGGAALVSLALLMSASCGTAVREGKSPSYLVMERLQAKSGTDTEFKDALQSDVLTKNSIYEDAGQVTLHVALKDPGVPSTPTLPAPMNYVTIERYHVNYVRSDGRNTQGVDVPYAFDGGVTGTISGIASSVAFVLVRAQAKFEAPLEAMRGIGGALVISTIAEVTFYGHDQAGNAVTVSGNISVNFSDWADPKS